MSGEPSIDVLTGVEPFLSGGASMADVITCRRGPDEVRIHGVGAVRERIRGAARRADDFLAGWVQGGRLLLKGWRGPHAGHFAERHGAAVDACLALISALRQAEAACARVGGDHVVGGGVPIATRLASLGGSDVAADPALLRRFATRYVDNGLAGLAYAVTTDEIRAEVVRVEPVPDGLLLGGPSPAPRSEPVDAHLRLVAPIAEGGRAHATVREAASFAGLVGEAFAQADAQVLDMLLTAGPATAVWKRLAEDGTVRSPDQLTRHVEGQELAAQLVEACRAGDKDRFDELAARIARADLDVQAGVVSAWGPDAQDELARLAEHVERPPEPRSGPLGVGLDFSAGLVDSVRSTGAFIVGASGIPDFLDDPSAGLSSRPMEDPESARRLARMNEVLGGLREGISDPVAFAKVLIDWEGLRQNKARWAGGQAPEAILAVASGGAAAIAKGAEGGLAAKAARLAKGVDRASLPVDLGMAARTMAASQRMPLGVRSPAPPRPAARPVPPSPGAASPSKALVDVNAGARLAAKPAVSDPKLGRLVDRLYAGAGNPALGGQGTLADKVRAEQRSCIASGSTDRAAGVGAEAEAEQAERRLAAWLEQHPDASASDRLAARTELADLRDALASAPR